ncbi:MAG: FxsA family protein [Bdellovibrionales bacterium]|nr:FxsA family protein [Bdellovibrionales bacterium]
MFAWIVLLLFVLPIFDLILLIRIGGVVGGGAVLLAVIASGFLGIFLARSQGRVIWRKINESLLTGQMPADSLLEGTLTVFGGIMLVAPGFLTDILGLFLLLPISRRMIIALIKRSVESIVRSGEFKIYRASWDFRQEDKSSSVTSPHSRGEGEIIDISPIKPIKNVDKN